MSYFTNDSPYKSNMETLVVDDNNLPAEKIGFWEQNYWQQRATFATDTPESKGYYIERALEERHSALMDITKGEPGKALKQFGWEKPFLSGGYGDEYKPWLGGGKTDERYEAAIEAYRNTLTPEQKKRLFVRDEINARGKQMSLEIRKEAMKKLEGAQYGWWGGILGDMVAYARDPKFILTQMILPEAVFAKLAAKGVKLSQKARVGLRAGVDMGATVPYEIATQKLQVQPYKQELGLPHTNSDVRNAVFSATIFAGIFGATFEGAAGAYRKVMTGEWNPKQAKSYLAENYDNLTPEQKEMVDMSLQAFDHEQLNPYGPEGRDDFLKESFEAMQRAHSIGRKVSDVEAKEAEANLKPADEDKEFEELRADFEQQVARENGPIAEIDTEISRLEAELEQLKANEPIDPEQAAKDGINDLLRAFGSSMELGDNFNSGFLRQMGLNREQIDDFTDYLMENGYLRDKGVHMQVKKLPGDEKPALKSPDDPAADALDIKLYNQLIEDAERLLPKGIRFETPKTLGEAAGYYSHELGLVRVALDAPEIGKTLRHEALHAVRDRFKPEEWATLEEAAAKIDFPKEGIYKAKGIEGDDLAEERVANLIEYAYKGGDISSLEPKPRGMIEKILAWIKALATTLKKPEYNQLKTILDDFESGAIAGRPYADFRESPADLANTPAFRRWSNDAPFIKGEVSGEYNFKSGEPVVLEAYRGEQIAIGEPELRPFAGSDPVMWATPSREMANIYAPTHKKEGPSIFPLFIKMDNPFVYEPGALNKPFELGTDFFRADDNKLLNAAIDDFVETNKFSADQTRKLKRLTRDYTRFANWMSKEDDFYTELVQQYGEEFASLADRLRSAERTTPDLINHAKALGHDGIIFKKMFDAGGVQTQYISFKMENVKSQFNRGTFDPDDPRILNDLKDTPESLQARIDELKARRDEMAGNPLSQFEIEIDGKIYTPRELLEAANDDMAMAENVKMCAMLGA